MNYSREEVARACRAWGRNLSVPDGIDGPQLLWALSGCESSFGANCAARHEPAYDVGGQYADSPPQAKLLKEFGGAAACSYGPWQIMFTNCLPGVTPADLERIDRCALETVGFIKRRILRHQRARTVAEIAISYNSGHWDWPDGVPAGVKRYAAECVKYYDSYPMPEREAAVHASEQV